MKNYALIFAGGSGTRMHSRSVPKQFLKLYGKEIIVYTLENFQKHKMLDGIVVACKKDRISFLKQLVQDYVRISVAFAIYYDTHTLTA